MTGRAWHTLLAAALLACGASPAAPTTPARTPDDVDAGPTPREEAAPVDAATLTALDEAIASLDTAMVRASPLPTIGESLAACPRADECTMGSTAAWDASADRWLILSVDGSEDGPASATLLAATAENDTVLARGAIDRAGLASLRRASRPHAALVPPANLVTAAAVSEFSSSTYPTLVALDAPLDTGLIELSTSTDLDHPEHVLWWIARSGHARTELARTAAALAPCDGDGWACDARDDGDCTAAELRAEGRLCVEPWSIDFVGLSPDGTSLVVLGTRIVAGDGGYPAYHWALPFTPPRAP